MPHEAALPAALRRFSLVIPGEGRNWEAALQAMEWGYPRDIKPDEADGAIWVRYGADVLVWYVAGPEPETLAAHVCAAPEARGSLGTPRQMHGMEVIAELMGAKRLYVITDYPSDFKPRPGLDRFLRMRGWASGELGRYRDLGGCH